MKLFYALIIIFCLQNCSFDNKTGIWKNENNLTKKESDLFKEFKALSSSNESFNSIILPKKNYKIKLSNSINNLEWNDIFYNQTNNSKNFKYNNNNLVVFKSKKISRHQTNDHILFKDNYIITSDQKGNLIIYSLDLKKIIYKFNFYQKRYKNIKKNLNLILDNNTLYVSDNIGYLYAIDFQNKKVLWAKNYKIPFRSNLKVSKNKLIASTQNNNLYFFNKSNGDLLSLIPTEETIVKNQFTNNLSLNNDFTFFLNTYGSLYSIDNNTMKIKWFINLNQSLDINPSNLFIGTEIINYNDKIIVSTNSFTYLINSKTGSIISKNNFSLQLRPVISNDYLFLITKNNLLICKNLIDGTIIFSQDINSQIANFLNIKKKEVEFKNIFLVNSNIYIFLKNSYILKFDINGKIKEVRKLPTKIATQPLFIDGSIIYLDKKNKILVLN